MVFSHFCHKKGIDLAILVLDRVWFLYSSVDLGMFFRRSNSFIIINKTINRSPSTIMFRATVSGATVINRASNFWSGHKYSGEKSQIFRH